MHDGIHRLDAIFALELFNHTAPHHGEIVLAGIAHGIVFNNGRGRFCQTKTHMRIFAVKIHFVADRGTMEINNQTVIGELIAITQRHDVRERFNVELKPEICVVDGNGCKEDQRYEEVLDVMYHCLPMFHRIGAAAYKPDLSNTERLMTALKHPYRKFKSVHVAGNNGKGSCSHMLASIFQSAGYKTGLYTSPHLRDFRERIRINGQMISKEAVVEFYEEHEDLFRKIHASFFEMTVAMAFDYFAKERVDVAIIEVGMGGRLDSTNVITPVLSLITNISWDHMQFLGDTLAKIAEEKAGIIKPGIPVVISETDPQTSLVFNRKAKECEAPVVYADARFSMKGSRMEEGSSFRWQSMYLRTMPPFSKSRRRAVSTVRRCSARCVI